MQLELATRPRTIYGQASWSDDQRRVCTVLAKHQGRANAIRRRDLAAQTGLSDRTVRDAVASLVIDCNVPVLSSPNGGYYLADRADEIESAAETLMSYIEHLSPRAAALRLIARDLRQVGRLVDVEG